MSIWEQDARNDWDVSVGSLTCPILRRDGQIGGSGKVSIGVRPGEGTDGKASIGFDLSLVEEQDGFGS